MNLSKYKLQDLEPNFDSWEFIHSLVFLREIEKPINILDIGEGNYTLLYALATEFEKKINSIYSIDVKNNFSIKDRDFYNKKIVYNAIHDRKCEKVFHEQKDCFNDAIIKDSNILFSSFPINFLMIEYLQDDTYMNKIFTSYRHLFDKKIQIYFHNLNKNENSKNYFEKLSISGKKIMLSNNSCKKGIGLIVDGTTI